MDHRALAEKIRRRIFDQAAEDGRVMHADSMDRVIAEVLEKEMPAPVSPWPVYGGLLVVPSTIDPDLLNELEVSVIRPGQIEWR